MTKLYTEFSELYKIFYQQFINYDEEYEYYKEIIDRHGCHHVLEIGCGTGELAIRFLRDGYHYSGLDNSKEMLAIAARTLPSNLFYQMDMRAISLPPSFDIALITARSISYLITNADVTKMLQSVKSILKKGGYLVFDFIDAVDFIPKISSEKVLHEIVQEGEQYSRESFYELKADVGWTWVWKSTFYKTGTANNVETIGEDVAELRSFTLQEIEVFLRLNNFKLMKATHRKVYAFNTIVVEALLED